MVASAWACVVDIPACSAEDIAGVVGRDVRTAVEAEEESSPVRHTAMAPYSGHHKAKVRMESSHASQEVRRAVGSAGSSPG